MIEYHVSVETGHGAEPEFTARFDHELREGEVFGYHGRSYRVLSASVDPNNPGVGFASCEFAVTLP